MKQVDATQKVDTCKQFALHVETGALNITPASSFYTTLMELAQMLPK
jgi:hypothetical protein